MSRLAFLATTLFFGVVAAMVIRPHAPHRDVWPQAWSASSLPQPSPVGPPPRLLAPQPVPQPPLPASSDGGAPVGLYAIAGAVLVAGAGAGVALGRRRRDEPSVEVVLQEHWYCILTAHTANGSREVRRGLVRWPALNAQAMEAEIVARHETQHGHVEGTVLSCRAVAASQWAIYAGAKIVARGPVSLDGVPAEDMAVQLLDEYAAERGLILDDVHRLRCAVWGPDGYGEADGRDW